MLIEFKKPFQTVDKSHKKGDVMEWPENDAIRLVNRGIAVDVTQKAAEDEPKADAEDVKPKVKGKKAKADKVEMVNPKPETL